jgi:hypothetical protein
MSNPEKWRGFAPLPPDIGQRVNELAPFLIAHDVRLAYLFGSLARASENAPIPIHDADLALLNPLGQPPYLLHQPLCEHLGIERLDLIDLRQDTSEFRFAIISEGRCLYAADDEERLAFELATLREYKDRAYVRRMHEQLLRERFARWS